MAAEYELGLRPTKQDVLDCLTNVEEVQQLVRIPVSVGLFMCNTCLLELQCSYTPHSISLSLSLSLSLFFSLSLYLLPSPHLSPSFRVVATKVSVVYMLQPPRSRQRTECPSNVANTWSTGGGSGLLGSCLSRGSCTPKCPRFVNSSSW